MNDDSVDTPNVVQHPVSIERRPVNYTSNSVGNGNNGEKKEFRKLHVEIGDMVQVIDQKSNVQGKYGLIQAIHPKNLQYQVLVRIGKINNPLKFGQIRFCTRIQPVDNGVFKKDNSTNIEEDYSEKYNNKNTINELIDVVDEESENSGNREGANLKHGKKL